MICFLSYNHQFLHHKMTTHHTINPQPSQNKNLNYHYSSWGYTHNNMYYLCFNDSGYIMSDMYEFFVII